MNRDLSSEVEHRLASELVAHLKGKAELSSNEKVLFEVAKNHVDVNIYGIIDSVKQERIINLLKEGLRDRQPVNSAVRVTFFPERVLVTRKQENGPDILELVRSEPFRRVELNELRP